MEAKTKKKHLWSSIKLRLTLFRIWFLKNILVFLQIIAIVSVILMLTGVITNTTPLIGKPLYAIFGPLIDEIVNIIVSKNISGLMDFFGIFISILVSVGMFTMKVKNIAQADIKSDKLKIALIQANLYFNEDGKLTKKVEKMTKTDIDGDGEVNGEATVNQGLISGMVSAIKEFAVIASADLSGSEEENTKEYENTIKKVGYEEVVPAVVEVQETIKTGMANKIADESIAEIDNRIEETKGDSELTTVEKTNKISLFAKLKNIFMNKKKSVNKDNVDVIENNIDKDAEIKQSKKEVKEEHIYKTPLEIVEKKEAPKTDMNNQTATADFLKRMRGGF